MYKQSRQTAAIKDRSLIILSRSRSALLLLFVFSHPLAATTPADTNKKDQSNLPLSTQRENQNVGNAKMHENTK